MNNWPDPNETEKLLSLTGLSGKDRDLIEWYLYDFSGEQEDQVEHPRKRRQLNSLLQSRFFELQGQQNGTTSNPR